MRHAQREDIRQLWPDKLLYSSIMMIVTGAMGVVHAALVLAFDIKYSKSIPMILHGWPPSWTLALSAIATVCAIVAMKKLSIGWGVGGVAAGFLSFALFGIASLFALVAGAFLFVAHREEEHKSEDAKVLSVDEWPDKSLAASLLLLMSGVVTLGWGGGVLAGMVNFGGELGPVLGGIQVVVAIGAFVAAYLLYHQRAPVVGWVAGGALILSGGAYVLGPVLGISALLTLRLAHREMEFG